jgi:hypothetical protein
LNNDRSTLTSDEWNLLSNVINTYNEQNLFIQSIDFLKNHFSLPPKIRSKDSNTLNHIGSLFSTIHTFIERCPFYYSLLNTVGSFNGFYMAKEMNIFENETYKRIIENVYGNDHSYNVREASQRLQQDGTLIKILLMIITFSSNSTIVARDHIDDIQIIFDPKMLINIENIFVTMLWKYLIYQYGVNEATLRFLSLIKSILDMMQRMHEASNVHKHWTMVGNIVERITYSLSVDDIPSKD